MLFLNQYTQLLLSFFVLINCMCDEIDVKLSILENFLSKKKKKKKPTTSPV